MIRVVRRAVVAIGLALVLALPTAVPSQAAIPLPHDAEPTFAFRLEHAGRSAAICTDMGEPERAAARGLADVELLVLEFNHDERMLASGPYTPALKRRIGGPRGHLSNEQAAQVLRSCAGARLRTLVLAHLSATNNRPELALASAQFNLGLVYARGEGIPVDLVAAYKWFRLAANRAKGNF